MNEHIDKHNGEDDLPLPEDLEATDAVAEGDASFLSFRPGQRLKKGRELRGLSLAQVSKELHISERYLQAIEADEYGTLPEPAFVRGYMRRYAQLVKLSPDDIASKFDECYAADNSTPEPDARPRNPIQILGDLRRPRIRMAKLLSLLSAALVIVLIFGMLFWKGFSDEPEPAVLPPEAAPADVQPLRPVPQPAPTPASPVSPTLPTLPQPGQPASLPEPQAPAAQLAPVVAPVVLAAPAADALALSFSGECWVSVRDAQGRELASGIKKAGESLNLSGQGPFVVNLGNASVARLSFNGQPVDLAPHVKGQVASLKLAR